jgi:DNA modification methylase
VAARRHDRRFLLIESVPRYVEMARRRLAAETL